MTVQVAFNLNSSNMHFILRLSLSLVCESGGKIIKDTSSEVTEGTDVM